MSPRHILVAVDFSEPSRRALKHAMQLRSRLHAALEIVHVFDTTYDAKAAAPILAAGLEGRLRKGAQVELEELVRTELGPDAQAVKSHLVSGHPAAEIIDLAHELRSDLIVMGTTGKSGVERMLLGSVASRVVRESDVPVLVVP